MSHEELHTAGAHILCTEELHTAGAHTLCSEFFCKGKQKHDTIQPKRGQAFKEFVYFFFLKMGMLLDFMCILKLLNRKKNWW